MKTNISIRDLLKENGFSDKEQQDKILFKWIRSTQVLNTSDSELRKYVIRSGSFWKSENGGMDEEKCMQEFIQFINEKTQ